MALTMDIDVTPVQRITLSDEKCEVRAYLRVEGGVLRGEARLVSISEDGSARCTDHWIDLSLDLLEGLITEGNGMPLAAGAEDGDA